MKPLGYLGEKSSYHPNYRDAPQETKTSIESQYQWLVTTRPKP